MKVTYLHGLTAALQVDPAVQKRFWQDRISVEWVKANTKNCPKCTVPIQKNDGYVCSVSMDASETLVSCSHMTCKKCCYQFCWICLGTVSFGIFSFF